MGDVTPVTIQDTSEPKTRENEVEATPPFERLVQTAQGFLLLAVFAGYTQYLDLSASHVIDDMFNDCSNDPENGFFPHILGLSFVGIARFYIFPLSIAIFTTLPFRVEFLSYAKTITYQYRVLVACAVTFYGAGLVAGVGLYIIAGLQQHIYTPLYLISIIIVALFGACLICYGVQVMIKPAQPEVTTAAKPNGTFDPKTWVRLVWGLVLLLLVGTWWLGTPKLGTLTAPVWKPSVECATQ